MKQSRCRVDVDQMQMQVDKVDVDEVDKVDVDEVDKAFFRCR